MRLPLARVWDRAEAGDGQSSAGQTKAEDQSGGAWLQAEGPGGACGGGAAEAAWAAGGYRGLPYPRKCSLTC